MDQYRTVERELAKKEIEITSVQSLLENAQKHIEEYKQVAESMEEELKKFKEEKVKTRRHRNKLKNKNYVYTYSTPGVGK